jgi:hypothetical protein
MDAGYTVNDARYRGMRSAEREPRARLEKPGREELLIKCIYLFCNIHGDFGPWGAYTRLIW